MFFCFVFVFRRGTGKDKCSCCWYIYLAPFFVVVVFSRRGTGKHKWGGMGGGGIYLTLHLLLVELPSAVFGLFLRRGTGKDKWCVCVCGGGGGGYG